MRCLLSLKRNTFHAPQSFDRLELISSNFPVTCLSREETIVQMLQPCSVVLVCVACSGSMR
jgi:hypothetical protein